MDQEYTYNPDQYWQNTEDSYPYYPTVRHRKRFILRALKKHIQAPVFSAFDFGCGEGSLLKSIQNKFGLTQEHIGGCDISKKATERAQENLRSPHLIHALYPKLQHPFDAITCCEVLEHTTEYADILRWMYENLKSGGVMIVTTQTGRIHASDRYTGHTQHFRIRELRSLLEKMGLEILQARLWGWPLFTIQKYLTNVHFDRIRKNYLEGTLTLRKKIVFTIAYFVYVLHDLIPFGPQIYIVARKP